MRRREKQKWDRVLMDGITLTNKSLVSAMISSLNQMEELRRLCVATYGLNPADISPFIRKFADQLTMLNIDFAVSMIGADVFPHLTRLRCRLFDAKSAAAFPKLAELCIYGIKDREQLPNMQLPSLKKLIITTSYYAGDWELNVRTKGFIVANADRLKFLKMTKCLLTVDHSVVFTDLIELDCMEVDVVAGRCGFPALTHLTVGRRLTDSILSILPADQMLSLDVHVYPSVAVVSAISRMRNLKKLKFISGERNEAFSSLFDNMHQLEKVQLHAYDFSSKQDGTIATLVNQNPNLSSVSFCHCGLTDADLTSLAQLQHLTDVSAFDVETKVTTAGVLTLLRGSSRKVIRSLSIDDGNVDYDQVTSEIRLMCEERGTTFDAEVTKDSFMFHIHN